MKIQIEVSDDNESTAQPWWIIIDPHQNLARNVDEAAADITGPFFSRAEAEACLFERRHHYSKRAMVYCKSGYATEQYREAIRDAWESGYASKLVNL